MLVAIAFLVLAAAPTPSKEGPPEEAAVLLAQAAAPDEKLLLESCGFLVPGSIPEFLPPGVAGAIGVKVAGLGRVVVTGRSGMFEGAEAAFKRGMSALITDTPLEAHAGWWTVELLPEAAVSRVAALDALARVTTGLARAPGAIGVYFAAGKVLHPAAYVLGASREKLPAAWLWVGLELGGTTSRVTLTSIGLAKAGLMELELGAKRAQVGAAIETFFDLIAVALARKSDFPNGHEIARKDLPPLKVAHAVRPDGAKIWTVEYPAP